MMLSHIQKVTRYFLLLLLLIQTTGLKAQALSDHTSWKFIAKEVGENTYDMIFQVTLEPKWHIYATDLGCKPDQICPEVTRIHMPPTSDITVIGKVRTEGKVIEEFDKNYELVLKYYEKKVSFIQRIKLNKPIKSLKAGYFYMVCDDRSCLAPDSHIATFSFPEPKQGALGSGENTTVESITPNPNETITTDSPAKTEEIQPDKPTEQTPSTKEAEISSTQEKSDVNTNLWKIFLGGFIGGLLALLTPCVFPMIPLTVSFFTKRSKTRAKGISNAIIYGSSIILIYVLLGFLVTKIFGADALNDMASNGYFNMAFFLIFLVFAFSFFGAFEITLPSNWVNAADKQSERGGLIGIFFMAFTLALVSFSCTGPIIGQLLVIAALGGGVVGPLVGMFGFSFALSLPFTLFAIFPTWLNSLPRSGGWLNSVKVVLGFIELALALKFLSAVDLAYHWDFFKREYFLALWIVIFFLLGFYLLGKLKFSHDSDITHISIPRLMFAIVSFAFAAYMVPGLWGAPINLLSGLAPPNNYTEGYWVVNTPQLVTNNTNTSHETTAPKKYGDKFHCPHGLNCYFDYDEALSVAKKLGKPLMIDFTGHACVNCRKMENTVWANPEVLKRLHNDFVLVSLYVDDKTELPENEQFDSKETGKHIRTLGNKWSTMEAIRYKQNTQPLYVLLDHNEQVLTEPTGYDPDVQLFVNFLEKGKAEFKKRSQNQ